MIFLLKHKNEIILYYSYGIKYEIISHNFKKRKEKEFIVFTLPVILEN